MNFTLDLTILFQLGSLAVIAGGAWVRLRYAEKRIEELKKEYDHKLDNLLLECEREVDRFRAEHNEYHEIRTDIQVVKVRLESLNEYVRMIVDSGKCSALSASASPNLCISSTS